MAVLTTAKVAGYSPSTEICYLNSSSSVGEAEVSSDLPGFADELASGADSVQ